MVFIWFNATHLCIIIKMSLIIDYLVVEHKHSLSLVKLLTFCICLYMCTWQEDALQLAAPANANGGPDLSEFECPPSPPSSYNNQPFSFDEVYYINEKGAGFRIEPPNLPQQLEEALVDMPPVPNHTQLNHLYCSKTNDADQAVMVNSTERFGARYITRAAAYKAASRTESCSKEIFFIE